MATGMAAEIETLPADATTAVVRRITNDRGEIVTVEIRHAPDGTYWLLASITGPRAPHQHRRTRRQEMHENLDLMQAEWLAVDYLDLILPDASLRRGAVDALHSKQRISGPAPRSN